jgi:HEAT repeat protein
MQPNLKSSRGNVLLNCIGWAFLILLGALMGCGGKEASTPEARVANAIAVLKKKEIWRDDVAAARIAAIRTLDYFAPKSNEAVAALIEVLHKPGTVDAHWEAIKALEKIGPFAIAAKDTLLRIIAAKKENEGDGPDLILQAAFSAVAAIGPHDQEVLDTLFATMMGTGMRAFDAIAVLDYQAGLYDEKVQQQVIRLLQSNPPYAPQLVRLAGKIQPNSARTVQFLIDSLHTQDFAGQAEAVKLLLNREIERGEEIVPDLQKLLIALKSDEPPRSLRPMRFGLNDPDVWKGERRDVIVLFGKIGPPARPAADLIREFKSDKDYQVRLEAVMALAEITGEFNESERFLRELYDPAQNNFPTGTYRSNIALRCRATIPVLITLLDDADKRVRYNVLMSVREAGTNAIEALPAVKRLLEDPSVSVRQEASNTIAKISPALGRGSDQR